LGHLFLLQAGNMGSSWRWEGAWAALAKSSLVAFSSVPWMQEALMDLGWTRGFGWKPPEM
jgi:hypothetical protein